MCSLGGLSQVLIRGPLSGRRSRGGSRGRRGRKKGRQPPRNVEGRISGEVSVITRLEADATKETPLTGKGSESPNSDLLCSKIIAPVAQT